jgi:hypothetical protein
MPTSWCALAALCTVRHSWMFRTGKMPVLKHRYYFFAVGGSRPFRRRYMEVSA